MRGANASAFVNLNFYRASSTNSSCTSETIIRSGLAAGTYYVNVYRVSSMPNTFYKLDLVNATVAPVDAFASRSVEQDLRLQQS